MSQPANDNTPILVSSIDHAIPGQALRLSRPHTERLALHALEVAARDERRERMAPWKRSIGR